MTNTRAEHTDALIEAWTDLFAAEGMRDTFRMMWQIESDNGRAKDDEIKRLREKNANLVEELRRTYERAVS